MLRTKIVSILFGLALLGLALPALAQVGTTGSITGRVSDDAGQPMAGVTVQATGPQSEEATITDEDGIFNIGGLPVGTYTLRFLVAGGGVKAERQNVIVSVDKTVKANVRLSAKAAEETVVITEKAPAIDVASSRTGTTMTKDFTDNVPTGRTFGSVISKAAGAFDDPVGVSIGGATGGENNYILDGVNVSSIGYGTLGSNLVTEFVQETEVVTGGYNAEYGRATGGVVNVVTKSGGNEFHGSVFTHFSPYWLRAYPKRIYNRSSALSGQTMPDYATDVGVEVGGPIVKNRAFFWVGFQPSFGKNHMVRIVDQLVDVTGPDLDGDGKGDPDGAQDTSDGSGAYSSPSGQPGVKEIYRTRLDGSSRQYQYSAKLSLIPIDNHSLSLGLYGSPRTAEGPRGASGDPRATMSKVTASSTDVSARWVSKLFDKKWQLEANGAMHQEKTKDESPYADMNALNAVFWSNRSPAAGGARQLPFFENRPEYVTGCADPVDPAKAGLPMPPADTRFDRQIATGFHTCPVVGYRSGGYDLAEDLTATRLAGQLKSTHNIRAGGHHVIKYGLDYELNTYDDSRGYSGLPGAKARVGMDGFGVDTHYVRSAYNLPKNEKAYQYYDGASSDDPSTPEDESDPNMNGHAADLLGKHYRDAWKAKTETTNLGFFAQDGYSILPNLTLNAGLRWESQKIGDFAGESQITINDMIAPRVGLVFDPTSEGKSKIFANYGRFYESVPMDINNRAFGNEGTLFTIFFDDSVCTTPFSGWGSGDAQKGWKSCDLNPMDDNIFNPTADPAAGNYSPGSGAGFGGNALVTDLKGTYSNEIVVGAQYELFEDFTLGASFINRNLGSMIEDAAGDPNHTYIVTNPGDVSDGMVKKYEDLAKAAEAAQAALPASASLAEKAKAAADAADARGIADSIAGIQKFPKPTRDYNALHLTATKRLSKSWLLQASYAYSRTIGNYPGTFVADNGQFDPNINSLYDVPDVLLNRNGPLPTDRPHLARLDGYYTMLLGETSGITAGVGYQMRSGSPLTYKGSGTVPGYGANESFILPRGSMGRTATISELDLHLAYVHKISQDLALSAFIDIFNVANSQTVLTKDQTYTGTLINPIVNGTKADLDYAKSNLNGAVVKNPNFGNATSRAAPVSGRLGLRLSF